MTTIPASVKYIDLANDKVAAGGVRLLIQHVLTRCESRSELFTFFSSVTREQFETMFDHILHNSENEREIAGDVYTESKAYAEESMAMIQNALGESFVLNNLVATGSEERLEQQLGKDVWGSGDDIEKRLKAMERRLNFLVLRHQELEKAGGILEELRDEFERQGGIESTEAAGQASGRDNVAQADSWQRLLDMRKRYIFLQQAAAQE